MMTQRNTFVYAFLSCDPYLSKPSSTVYLSVYFNTTMQRTTR